MANNAQIELSYCETKTLTYNTSTRSSFIQNVHLAVGHFAAHRLFFVAGLFANISKVDRFQAIAMQLNCCKPEFKGHFIGEKSIPQTHAIQLKNKVKQN